MKFSYIFIFLFIFLSYSSYGQNGTLYKGNYYQPMPMPVGEFNKVQNNTKIENISYKIETKSITKTPLLTNTIKASDTKEAKTFDQLPKTETFGKSFSNLTLVNDPEAYPNSVNVKLFMEYPSGNFFVCTGTLIDDKHVLTAGHCIHNQAEGGWASNVEVIPAFENGSTPYGSAFATNIYSWTGWTSAQDYNWDMAYMELDRYVGGTTGWNGIGYNTNNSIYTSGNWVNNSYPAETPYDGQFMYTWNGTFDDVQTDLIYHDDLGYGGQSGSGTHDDLIVHSVASHTFVDQNNNRIPPLAHCRMTQTRFDAIVYQIEINTPNGVDLVPIDTYAAPATVSAGAQLDSLSIFVFNGGEAAFNGTLDMSFYLSDNDIISSGDLLMNSYTWSNVTIAPNESFYAWISESGRPVIPTNLSEGTYYIGLIINNNDADTNNNITTTFDVAEINVVQASYCQGTSSLTNESGNFSDGSGADNYNNNSDCGWHINPPNASEIVLQFSQFDLENSYDFVYVYSDLAETQLVATLTGSSIPQDITISGNEMAVRFISDGSVRSSGFEANYYSILPNFCSGVTTFNQNSMSFTDGSGSDFYLNNSDCRWIINPPNASEITLSFTAFDLENSYDFIYVYDDLTETNVVATLTGNSIPNDIIINGNEMVVRFTSDGSVVSNGFECYYFSSSTNCYNDDIYLPEGIIDSEDFNTDYTISSQSTIPANEAVLFNGLLGVTLDINFSVENNAVFEVKTEGCNNN